MPEPTPEPLFAPGSALVLWSLVLVTLPLLGLLYAYTTAREGLFGLTVIPLLWLAELVVGIVTVARAARRSQRVVGIVAAALVPAEVVALILLTLQAGV